MKKQEALDTAKDAVADREVRYGNPEAHFNRVAAYWMAHLAARPSGTALNASDVAQMMILLKLARLQNQPDHVDSWVDIAGYAACGVELFDKKETR